jgi:hypothetical protein
MRYIALHVSFSCGHSQKHDSKRKLPVTLVVDLKIWFTVVESVTVKMLLAEV